MNRVGADFFNVISQIEERLGHKPIALQIPIGSEDDFRGVIDLIEKKAIIWRDDDKLGVNYDMVDIPEELEDEADKWRDRMLEAVAELDETLMEKYFEDPHSITSDQIKNAIRKGTLEKEIVPILCGAAFKNKGIQRLLDAVCSYLPSPPEVGGVNGFNPKDHDPEFRKAEINAPLSALVFKITTDPFVGRLAYARIYSGKITSNSNVYNPRIAKKERVTRLYQMHANKQNQKKEICAGDICGIVGLKNIKTGDTLCDLKKPISLESMTFPDPVISIVIEPRTQQDIEKLTTALVKLEEEDPTFQVKFDKETGQTVINGMGELHLEVLIDRLKREFGVECNIGKPQVAYREQFVKEVEHREIFKKQTGGKGKFADIKFTVGPADEGEKGLQFVNEVKGGNIPKDFIPSIEKGFVEGMKNGPLAGYPILNMKVVLHDGSYHEVDSDTISFEIAAISGLKKAAAKAKTELLEPIMKAEVITPEEYVGDIISDFNKRRGEIEGMESKAGARVIRAKVPLAEKFGYVTVLRTLTSGRATSNMEFSHYQRVPEDVAGELLDKLKWNYSFV